MTALFCDIVGSVDLLNRLGPDGMSDVLGVYYDAANGAIEAFGGHVNDYLGDGILAYFGYPDADEDDPANAIRAALRLRAATAAIALPGGGRLQTRIGVATSLVVVDGLGRGERARPTLIGTAPTLAARLMAIARPDTIAVEHGSRRITQRHFGFTDLGPIALKGFSDAILVSEVDSERPAPDRFDRRARRATPPLFGRDAELGRLRDAWNSACNGRGRAVLLVGEPGIGKSHLARALMDDADAARHRSAIYHCAPRRSSTELYPIIENTLRFAGVAPDDPAARRREKVNALLWRSGIVVPASRAALEDLLGVSVASPATKRLSPEQRRQIMFDALLELIDPFRGTNPILLLVEDVHWADPTTLDLILRVVSQIAERPWCLVMTTRPDPLLAAPEWAAIDTIRLDHLGDSDAARVCHAVDPQTELPPQLVRSVVERCGGNPLFLEEVTRSVLDEHGRAADRVIPETLQASLAARLDRLGPHRAVLSAAALLGQRFQVELLGFVLERDEAELAAALSELARQDLLSAVGPHNCSYRFRHALFRDAAYEALLIRERERLHGRVVAALRATIDGDQPVEPERFAFHLAESGETGESIPFWVEAARRAGSRAAHTEAAEHLSAALRAVATLPEGPGRDERRLSLLLALASSLAASRGYSAPEVGTCVTELRALGDRVADTRNGFLVQSACYSFAIVAGDLHTAEALALACTSLAARHANVRQDTSAAAMHGFALFARGRFDEARPRLRHAISTYHANGPFQLPQNAVQDPLIVCLAVLPLLEHAQGDDVAARRDAAELIVHARKLGRDYDLAYSLCWRALFEIASGNRHAATPLLREALEISDRNDFRLWKASAGLQLAFATDGDPAASLASALRDMAELDRIGLNLMRSFYLWQIAKLHAAAGAPDVAAAVLKRAIDFAEQTDERILLAPLLRTRADLLAVAGLHADADQHHRSARLVASEQRAWREPAHLRHADPHRLSRPLQEQTG